MVHPDYGPGYDLWVGGGLSTNPMLAVRLGAWSAKVEVAEVWAGVVGLFRDYGYRRLRTGPGSSSWSPTGVRDKFRDVLETEYLHRPLLDGPAPAIQEQPGTTSACAQKDGQFFVGLAAVAGRVSGSRLIALADLAETHGQDGCGPRRCRRSWCWTCRPTRSTRWWPGRGAGPGDDRTAGGAR